MQNTKYLPFSNKNRSVFSHKKELLNQIYETAINEESDIIERMIFYKKIIWKKKTNKKSIPLCAWKKIKSMSLFQMPCLTRQQHLAILLKTVFLESISEKNATRYEHIQNLKKK